MSCEEKQPMSYYDRFLQIMTQQYDPKKIALEKADAYLEYIIHIFDSLSAWIAATFNTIREMHTGDIKDIQRFCDDCCFRSCAGDYTGDNNTVINFGYGGKDMDIEEALKEVFSLYKFAYDMKDNNDANE